jgi:lysylphosphatidylglycerol synthetase-like protein (DUF2156 family)
VNESAVGGRALLVRETLIFAGLVTSVSCALVGLLADPRLAITIALGAVIAGANFLLLARGIARAIDRASEEPGGQTAIVGAGESDRPHEPAPTSENGLRSGFRLALLLLAMVGILWYMPARPEGLAVGVLIVLVAATVAGFRHNRAI